MTTEHAQNRRPRRQVDGILLLDKPAGLSSNAALQRAKRVFRAKKAGHTGSLDVLATGLLPICFGEATKVCAFLLEANKRYQSRFQLGVVTNTGDAEGEPVTVKEHFVVEQNEAERAAQRFVGEIEQVPPMYSALKHNGRRLYKLAHQGIEVERAPRRVSIYEFNVLGVEDQSVIVDVACSKGTYIRTLAQDFGDSLGCGAHVAELRRTAAGPFDIEHSVSLDAIEEMADRPDAEKRLDDMLIATDCALVDLPGVHLSDDSAFYLCRGQAVQVPDAPHDGLVRLYGRDDEFLGVGRVMDDGRVAPRRLMR